MNALALIQIALALLRTVLGSVQGLSEYANIAAGVEAAIKEIEAVHGTPVTRDQLEGLRVSQVF